MGVRWRMGTQRTASIFEAWTLGLSRKRGSRIAEGQTIASPRASASWMMPRETIDSNELDLLDRAARGAPPRRPLVRVEDLEIPLVGAQNADDEAERLLEKRPRVFSIVETEEAEIEIALLPEAFVVTAGGRIDHGFWCAPRRADSRCAEGQRAT